ncbi:hypothetical protein ACJX0J_019857, partial [Zea mays]
LSPTHRPSIPWPSCLMASTLERQTTDTLLTPWIYIYVHQFSHRFQTLAQIRLQKQSKQLEEWTTAAFSSELTATKHKE